MHTAILSIRVLLIRSLGFKKAVMLSRLLPHLI
jgi:hypothetical protein